MSDGQAQPSIETDEKIVYATDRRPSLDAYVSFLSRSDLGLLYPPERREARIATALQTVGVCVTAWREGLPEDDALVGACLGVSDGAYFLFLTDLGVDRTLVRRGIARRLVELAWVVAGGRREISLATWTVPAALPFYERMGIEAHAMLVGRGAG